MPGLKRFRLDDEDTIEESPLLAREGRGNLPSSSVQPDKFDMSRFSDRVEREDREESPFRVIMYIIIVIIIGVGLALGVRYFISRQSEERADDTTEETPEETSNAVSISTTERVDALADNIATPEEFVDSSITTIGVSSADSSALVTSSLAYSKFVTFSRVEFGFEGLPTNGDFPRMTVSYDSAENSLNLTIPEDATVVDELTETVEVGDIVTSVTYSDSTKTFTLTLAGETKYRVLPTENRLIIDLRTPEQESLVTEVPEETTVEEPTTPEPEVTEPVETTPEPTTTTPPTSTNTPGKPAAPHYTNEFSQSEQFISSSVSGATINHNRFYYADTVDFFEFAWGTENNEGDTFISNSSAKLVEESGRVFIEVSIENLSAEAFSNYNISGTDLSSTGVDLTYANFIRADRISFTGGKAVYRIEIKRKADFKLISEKTLDGRTQVIALLIKDV